MRIIIEGGIDDERFDVKWLVSGIKGTIIGLPRSETMGQLVDSIARQVAIIATEKKGSDASS